VPSHVFISYHNGDRPYVEKLAAHLITSGFAVWYDFGLAAGQPPSSSC